MPPYKTDLSIPLCTVWWNSLDEREVPMKACDKYRSYKTDLSILLSTVWWNSLDEREVPTKVLPITTAYKRVKSRT